MPEVTKDAEDSEVSIRAPVRERSIRRHPKPAQACFNPRPREGAMKLSSEEQRRLAVSIRAPVRERSAPDQVAHLDYQFQSAPP